MRCAGGAAVKRERNRLGRALFGGISGRPGGCLGLAGLHDGLSIAELGRR